VLLLRPDDFADDETWLDTVTMLGRERLPILLLAELIVDRKTSADIHELRPSRFIEGKLILGPELL
jgi:hypothetical protein